MIGGNTAFFEHSLKLWEGLSHELSFNVMLSQRGQVVLGHGQAQMDVLARRGNIMRLNGIDAELLDRGEVMRLLPTPAAVEIEIPDRRATDEGTPIPRHVLNLRPMPQQTQAGDRRDQRHRTLSDFLHLGELPALRVAVEAVDVTSEHRAPLVRLRDVEELRVEGDHMIYERLNRLRNKGLQQMTLDRELEPRHRGHMRGMSGHDDRRPSCRDLAPPRPHPHHSTVPHQEAQDLAILEDVDPQGIRCPRIAPRDRIMPHRPGASLKKCAPDRKARPARVVEMLSGLQGHAGLRMVSRAHIAHDEEHALNREFSLDRFVRGAELDEQGVGNWTYKQ